MIDIKELNEICKRLDDRYDINSGGCCYLAYLIAKHLDKLGIQYELKIFDSFYRDTRAINEEVRFKKCNNTSDSVVGPYSCNHYYIHIINIGDVNDAYDDFYDKQLFSITKIKATNIRWIYKLGNWNDCYNTKHNRYVSKIINKFFKKYETD